MHFRKLSSADWRVVEEKFEKKTKQLERETYVGRRPAGSNKFSPN